MAQKARVRRPLRGPAGFKPEVPMTGIFSGTAQAGTARPKRAHALAEEMLTRGNMFIQKQVWDEAAREFRKGIKMEPEYAEAHNNLGLCLLYANKAEESVESFKQALHFFPGWSMAEANLGLAYTRLQHHAQAAECYHKALDKKPVQPTVWLALGDELAAMGKADKAMEAYQKAVEQSPKYDMAFVRIGMLQARRNKIDEAKVALAKAVAIEPDNPDAMGVLGAIAARQGNLNQARSYFDKVKDLDPVPPPAARGTHRLEVFQSGLQRGFEEWKKVMPQPPSLAMCCYNLGLAQLLAGNQAAAKQAFQQATAAQPDWAEPLIWFGFFSALDGDAMSARKYWDSVLKLQPDNGLMFEQLAYVAVAMGLQKEADALFEKALDVGREIPEDDLKPDGGAN
ncbi:MAG: tetratricopeptide repeat protein [Planctomycetota bacterium]